MAEKTLNLNEVFSSPEELRVLDSIAAGPIASLHTEALFAFEELVPWVDKETLWSAIEWYSKECLPLKEGMRSVKFSAHGDVGGKVIVLQWMVGTERRLRVRLVLGGTLSVCCDRSKSDNWVPLLPGEFHNFWLWVTDDADAEFVKHHVSGPLVRMPGEESDRSTVLILAGYLQGMSTLAAPGDRDMLLRSSWSLLAYAALLEEKPKNL